MRHLPQALLTLALILFPLTTAADEPEPEPVGGLGLAGRTAAPT